MFFTCIQDFQDMISMQNISIEKSVFGPVQIWGDRVIAFDSAPRINQWCDIEI